MNPRLPARVGGLLLGAFVVAERSLRHGESARTLHAGADDDGTTRVVGGVFGAVLTFGPLLARWRRGRLPTWAGWTGVGLMVGGLGLRLWSARALGTHYTRTLRIEGDHVLAETGPYSQIRHPGYAGTMTMLVGYGLTLMSLPATVGIVVPVTWAYHRRIEAEEAMLAKGLGEPYLRYQDRTDRLIPKVY